jgi:LPXTG-site transpeptidase (sortase) family protein
VSRTARIIVWCAVFAALIGGIAAVVLVLGGSKPATIDSSQVGSTSTAGGATGTGGTGTPNGYVTLPATDPGQPAQPRHITIPAIGVDAAILPYDKAAAEAGYDGYAEMPCFQNDTIVCVDPPTMEDVYWQVGGLYGVAWGDMPGTETRGTVYLYGHAGNPASNPVFNDLSELQPGDTAEVSTDFGIFTYTVESVRNLPKDSYTTDPEILKQEGGRLLLVTCYHGDDAELKNGFAVDNTVATLTLTSVREPDE